MSKKPLELNRQAQSPQPENFRVVEIEPDLPDSSKFIPDLKPLGDRILESKSEHELKEKEKETSHSRTIHVVKTVWGLLIMSGITIFVLVVLSITFWKMISVIFEPDIQKEDKQLAISIASIIIGGAITFLLTNVIPFFEKKD